MHVLNTPVCLFLKAIKLSSLTGTTEAMDLLKNNWVRNFSPIKECQILSSVSCRLCLPRFAPASLFFLSTEMRSSTFTCSINPHTFVHLPLFTVFALNPKRNALYSLCPATVNLSFDLCSCSWVHSSVFFPRASPLLCASLPWVFALTKHWTIHPLGPVYYAPSALLQVSWLKWVSGASMWPGPASCRKMLECRWISFPHTEMGTSLAYGGQSCALTELMCPSHVLQGNSAHLPSGP